MKHVVIIAIFGFFAGCGADGEPVTPTVNSSVTLGTNGVGVSTSVGVKKGPFTLGINL